MVFLHAYTIRGLFSECFLLRFDHHSRLGLGVYARQQLKPLTEEEKREKLAELRSKMASKRAVKAEQDAKEAKENEKLRRKQGKVRHPRAHPSLPPTDVAQDTDKIKEDLKAKEIVKEAEQRRRGNMSSHLLLFVQLTTSTDKIEDAKAREAVRAQIEADKKSRAEKAAREKALREGRPIVDDPAASSSAAPAASGASSGGAVAGKDFKDTRLQIRLASGGTPYVTTLPSDSSM